MGTEMGMYTELNINVEFKKDADPRVIAIIRDMCNRELDMASIDTRGLEHPLFQTERWVWMLYYSGGSACFPGTTALVTREPTDFEGFKLHVCTSIKNYSQEWEHFLSFISPHLNTEGYLGTYRYEEHKVPTLLFRGEDGEIAFVNLGYAR